MENLTELERGLLLLEAVPSKSIASLRVKAVNLIDEQAAEIRELENKGYKAAALLIDAYAAAHNAEDRVKELNDELLKKRITITLLESDLKVAEKQRDDAVLLAMGRASAETYYAEVQARKNAESELTVLRGRVAKAIQILSNQGTGTWYAVPALEALRG